MFSRSCTGKRTKEMSTNKCLLSQPNDPCYKTSDPYDSGYSAYRIWHDYPILYRTLRQKFSQKHFTDSDIILCKKHFNWYIQRNNPSVQCSHSSSAIGNYSLAFRQSTDEGAT
jgi:hypothetical protein